MVAVDLGLAPEPEAKNPNPNNQSSIAAYEEDGDSWEVRMFEEDALVGCTWPPRYYTCTFCKRVFGSAQALGGHMNVHRRERAMLNRANRNGSKNHPSSSSSSPALIIPTQEFFASGNGLCLLYSFPNPNPNTSPNPIMVPAHAMDPSTHRSFMSISPPPPLAADGSLGVGVSFPFHHQSARNSEEVALGLGRSGNDGRSNNNETTVVDRFSVLDGEEIDLELRLGRRKESN